MPWWASSPESGVTVTSCRRRVSSSTAKGRSCPAFGQMVRLSASALLEMEVCQLLNQCEEVCGRPRRTARHQELNLRYERLESHAAGPGHNQKPLEWIHPKVCGHSGVIRHRRTGDRWLRASTATRDPAPHSRRTFSVLQSADDTLRQLRHMLHQTQELRLLKAARPLARHEVGPLAEGLPLSSISTLFKQIQNLGSPETNWSRNISGSSPSGGSFRTRPSIREHSPTPGTRTRSHPRCSRTRRPRTGLTRPKSSQIVCLVTEQVVYPHLLLRYASFWNQRLRPASAANVLRAMKTITG